MTRRLEIFWLCAKVLFGIGLACDIWNLADRSAQLMGMLP